ncbi:hypothetical protein HanRHA438_Chr14g0662291 [Helianthus annuus]|nr:hypothetical protein HanRHA438_Chr14g0662291 [Helianthus annuus]
MEAPQVEAMSTETRNNNPPQDDEQDNIIDTWLVTLIFNFSLLNYSFHLILFT